jgi:hypothetical protein
MGKVVALVTPSHRNDIDRFKLLCESIDRHVTGYSHHYVIVNDDDMALFAPYNSARRIILPSCRFLPNWLRLVPRIFLRKNRRLWWSFRYRPVHGWHVQQLIKIEAALTLPEQRFCIIDSDNVFFRPFDVATYAGADRIPLHVDPCAITAEAPLHSVWSRNCDRLLGHGPTDFPADDYIGNLIVWDKAALQDMTSAIERISRKSWVAALCGTRSFSEYLLYGHFVRHSRQHSSSHQILSDGPSAGYWEKAPLSLAQLRAVVDTLPRSKVALCVESFSETPVSLIREVAGL